MKAPGLRALVLLLILLGAASCGPALRDPVRLDFSSGVLDLQQWNFEAEGLVVPQGWLWDADVLWSPAEGGRPLDLPPALAMGPPDQGGVFTKTLMRPYRPGREGRLVAATARMSALVGNRQTYDLQIGAVPGAFRVWVNGVQVWESGVLSLNPEVYRPGGPGTVLSVSPRDGRLDLVVQIVTSDPLIRHSELDRRWILGPSGALVAADRAEDGWRVLQSTFLLVGIFLFTWLSRLRLQRRSLVYFVAFLGVCLLKLAFNVEQPQPFLSGLVPWLPFSTYLWVNHGLNLLPYPLLYLFLVRQYPEDLGPRPLKALVGATALVTIWELLPFAILAGGWEEPYAAVLGAAWSFVLNLFVLVGTLFLFERCYHLYTKGRPLARSLFFGGALMGLLVLVPLPLSYFLPVKYSYFLGWGMFFFLLILGIELVRLQVRASDDEIQDLTTQLHQRAGLARFVSPAWAPRLGRPGVEDLRPGDRRPTEAVLVQVRASADLDGWLAPASTAAAARQAILVDWTETSVTWALDTWSETALAFSLELHKALAPVPGLRFRVVLTKAVVEFAILDGGPQWLPVVKDLPRARLEELQALAERCGSGLVLDAKLQDGLVIGGWRRHRHLTAQGGEIELYEYEDEALAQFKDRTLDGYEAALAQARAGHRDEALKILFPIAQLNPFDLAARALLVEWGTPQPE